MAENKTSEKKKAEPNSAIQTKKVSKAQPKSARKPASKTKPKATSKKTAAESKSSSVQHKKSEKKPSSKAEAKSVKKEESDQPKNTRRKRIISFIAILFIFLIVLVISKDIDLGFLSPESTSGIAVDVGDTVSVNYIGSYTDGEVFDTSYEQTAKDEGLYTEGRDYSPLTFTVGAGQMIPGFDSAVAGMKLGETKTVTISPEDAYGESDPEMIIDIPTALDRMMYLDSQFSISPYDFENAFAKEAVLDDIVGEMFPWNFKVISVSDENITLKYMMEIDDIFVMPQTAWNSTVIDMNETTITVMQNPVDGQIIETFFGPASIALEDDRITLVVDIEVGKQIMIPSGQGGTVVSVNDDSITLDINPPMAGKTLIFEITVENVTKADVE